MGVVRDAVIGRVHIPIENEDLAARENATEVVEGAALAEPDFQHRPRPIADLGSGEFEAGALRREPRDHPVEARVSFFAHRSVTRYMK